MSLLVRPRLPSDPVSDLTRVLNRAYKELADQGLNYTACDQDDATTLERSSGGVCFLAFVDGQLAGTVMLGTEQEDGDPPEYLEPQTAVLCQFGVDPDFRGLKVGDRLVAALEEEARRLGYSSLALDTAETARHLIEYYERRGFRAVGHHQWHGKSYRSVVMSKTLVPAPHD